MKSKINITISIAGYSYNDVIYPRGNSTNTHATAPRRKKFFLVILFNIKPIKNAPRIPNKGIKRFKIFDF